jgi:hypothetical protein
VVFEIAETAIVNSRDGIVRYRSSDPKDRRLLLAYLEVELRQAHEAVQSLRRRSA